MLRTRLFFGMALPLLIILLFMGLYSIDRCSELGHRIEAVSRDLDGAGRNLEQMKHSGAAMTSALLLRVTGDAPRGRAQFAAARGQFEQSLAQEGKRTDASPEEQKLIAQLAKAYPPYTQKAWAFLNTPDTADTFGQTEATRLGGDTYTLLDLVDQLKLAHEKGISPGGADTGAYINETVRSLILLMGIAAVVALAASVSLSRGLLNPLRSLTRSIQLIGEGNLDQALPVASRDELGQLANSFNQMAAQLKKYKDSTSDELVRLNRTIRTTLASFPDPIFVLNSEGAVEFRNPEADELALKLLFSGVSRLPEEVDRQVEQVRQTGQDYLPTLFKDAVKFQIDGQDRYFLPRIVLLRDEKRETFGVAVILENVTRMLLLDDVKSNLISTVSHELKTPLTSLRMSLYLLVEKTVGPLNDPQLDLVLTARQDADRLLHTLNDLLDLAKLEQGSEQLFLEHVPAAEIVTAALYNSRELAAAAQITLREKIAPALPAVTVDRQRIAYVFANFITNAIKYSPSGSEILVRADLGKTRENRPSVRFSVRDRGPGITPDHQAHIFERFYRVPGTDKAGAGLGLSIAREVVVAHQGEIGVISQPGEGSEFFFMVPIEPAPAQAPSNHA